MTVKRQTKPVDKDKHSVLQLKLQEEINSIVRTIDYDVKCIYCRENEVKAACHFHSVGSNCSLRYNLHNIFGGGKKCNQIDDRDKFETSIVRIYGASYLDMVQDLAIDYPEIKLSSQDLQNALLNAKDFYKQVLERTDIKTPQDRIRVRTEGNKFIGIYLK